MLPSLLDIIIPIVGYFILHAAGLSDFWALTIAGAVTALNAIVNTIRRGKLDAIGTLVVLEIALSVMLFFITRDPRIVLLKPSFYTALAGLYLFYTCLTGRPFTFHTSKPFATQGDPERERAYERAWTDSPGLRHEHQLLTAGWATLWLAESVIRGIVVLHTSITEGVLAGQLPAIIAVTVGIVFTRLRIPKLRRYISSPRAAEQPAPAT